MLSRTRPCDLTSTNKSIFQSAFMLPQGFAVQRYCWMMAYTTSHCGGTIRCDGTSTTASVLCQSHRKVC